MNKKWNHCIDYICEKKYRILLTFVFIAVFLKILYFINLSMVRLDLFFYIKGGEKILNGEILYKNFGDIKPPGIFFIFSFILKIFGKENVFIGIKLFSLLFQVSSAFVFFKVGEGLWNKKKGFFLGALFLILISLNARMWPTNVMLLYFLPFSIGLYCFVKYLKQNKSVFIFCSAFFLGICFIISTNTIFYVLIFPTLFIYQRQKIRTILKNLAFAALGFIIPILSCVLYFYYYEAMNDFYWWNIKWPLIYGKAYPLWLKLWKFFYGIVLNWQWLPFSVFAIYTFIKFIRSKDYMKDQKSFFIFIISISSILSRLMLNKDVSRYYLYLLPFYLFIMMYYNFSSIFRKLKHQQYVKAIFCLVSVVCVFYNLFFVKNKDFYGEKYEFEKHKPAITCIKNNIAKGKKIFIWPEGYEFYFYSGKDMATSFFSASQHLDYPYIWERNKYKDIDYPWKLFLRELDRDKPEIIVDVNGNNFSFNKEKKRKEKLKFYMGIFRSYVNKNYIKAKKIGKVEIWRRIR